MECYVLKKELKCFRFWLIKYLLLMRLLDIRKNWNILELLNNKKSEKWCGDVC